MAKASDFDVREAALEAGQLAVQQRGYNALSFRTLAADVGVKSATLHYHFPNKGDLAAALVSRYADDFDKVMGPHSEKPFEDALDAYLKLFKVAFDGSNRMCLGGMMSAEVSAMSDEARAGIKRFARGQIDWLKGILAKKYADVSQDQLEIRAKAIFTALEGAMLITRGQGEGLAEFDKIVETYRTTGLIG